MRWVGLLAAILCAAPVAAQETRALEEELSRLRERVAILEAETPPGPDPSEEAGGWRPALPQAILGGFADVNFDYWGGRLREGDPPNPASRWKGRDHDDEFFLGNFDLFVASQLSERFTFLTEILFEFEEHETEIDAERLLLRYEHADWLRASVGRGHTPIGYWNKHFHHGAWLWTTERRPLLYEFEDDNGPLPVHFVGLEVAGVRDTEFGLLGYSMVVSNGRPDDSKRVQIVGDLNDGKMTALALSVIPRLFPGLEVGANVLYDEIPARGSASPAWANPIHEVIAGGYAAYDGPALTLILEGQYIHHGTQARDYDSFGGYAQTSYRFGVLTPYYRFDWLSINDQDPFYREYSDDLPDGGVAMVVDTRQHTAGVRYDWSAFVALKLEYRRVDSDVERSNAVGIQAALAF